MLACQGDVENAVSIMREAAQWLMDTGRPMWSLDELTPQTLARPPEAYWVLYNARGEGLAALLLDAADPLFWPDVPPNTACFVHKLSVRRAWAGKGLPELLIHQVAEHCRQKGINSLCLDCDPHRPELSALYERMGFVRVGLKTFQTRRMGVMNVALYRLDLAF